MKRGRRRGIDKPIVCDLSRSETFIRGDLVSIEMTNGYLVEMPGDWGLIHDPSGACVDRCEVFVAPYSRGRKLRDSEARKVGSDAIAYYGSDTSLYLSSFAIPHGPWLFEGDISCINYDRYGELKGPYYHDTDVPKKRAERAKLFRQKRSEVLCGKRVRAFRISLPDGCKINAHGFVWP